MSEVIYGLIDPANPGEIRYIGKTLVHRTKKRLAEHVQAAKRGTSRRCYTWMRKVLKAGLDPIMVVLREVADGDWEAAETGEIERHRAAGHRLTNSTDGGVGIDSLDRWAKSKSREAAARASARRKGEKLPPRSEAHCKAISAALKGRSVPEETRIKIIAARTGKALTDAHRESISRGHLLNRKTVDLRPPTLGKARGSDHGSAKITEEQARQIKNSLKTCSQLAEIYGLSRGYVAQIKGGKKWAHI